MPENKRLVIIIIRATDGNKTIFTNLKIVLFLSVEESLEVHKTKLNKYINIHIHDQG